LQVMVLDKKGHATKAGSEVRLFEPATRNCLGTRIMDTGGGYCSQNIMPVHFGLPKEEPVDVEVTSFGESGRIVTRVAGVSSSQLASRVLTVNVP
jgi:hypothetical protein